MNRRFFFGFGVKSNQAKTWNWNNKKWRPCAFLECLPYYKTYKYKLYEMSSCHESFGRLTLLFLFPRTNTHIPLQFCGAKTLSATYMSFVLILSVCLFVRSSDHYSQPKPLSFSEMDSFYRCCAALHAAPLAYLNDMIHRVNRLWWSDHDDGDDDAALYTKSIFDRILPKIYHLFSYVFLSYICKVL